MKKRQANPYECILNVHTSWSTHTLSHVGCGEWSVELVTLHLFHIWSLHSTGFLMQSINKTKNYVNTLHSSKQSSPGLSCLLSILVNGIYLKRFVSKKKFFVCFLCTLLQRFFFFCWVLKNNFYFYSYNVLLSNI